MTTMEERERYERLYHSTTQHLLTRDFQAAESTVLSLLSTSTVPEDRISYHAHGLPRTVQGWLKMSEERIKAYKLWVFVLVSKYTESLASSGQDTGVADGLFDKITETYLNEHLEDSQRSASSSIHPSILHTILLSLLKIHSSSPTPYSDSLPAQTRQGHPLFIARQEIEKWLTGLEGETIDRLSHPRKHKLHHAANGNGNGASSSSKNGTEDDWVLVQSLTALSKGYKQVLKIYVLEILPRFEDWELSREMILGGLFPKAEEQEKLLKKLHSLETQHKAHQQTRSLSASTSLTNSATSLSSSFFSESNSLSDATLQLPSPSPSNSANARTPSLSAFSALTDRTVRPGDFYRMGSPPDDADSSKLSKKLDMDELQTERKESSIVKEEKGDDVSLVLTPTSMDHYPTGRRHSAFETMRQRIVRYLDTPLSTSDSQGETNPSDRRRIDLTRSRSRTPLHLRLSRSPLFTGMIRALSVVSIIWFMLGMLQRRRRRRAARAGTGVDGVGGVNGIVEEVVRVLAGILGTVKEVVKMGTTITYV